MRRDIRSGLTTAVATAALLAGATSHSVYAQRIPLAPGATVRLSRPDSTGRPFWSTGRVAYATRDGLLLEEPNAKNQLISYNETLRLQVRRGERRMTAVGGGIGFIVGALVKTRSIKSPTSPMDRKQASLGPMLVGGVVGAAAGALAAPLEESNTQLEFSLSRTVRWTAFEPTFADFRAFFQEHEESLDPVEGVWVRTGTHDGIAIVRVTGRDEETYAAYQLREYNGPGRFGEDGVLVFALTRANGNSNEWRFQLARSSRRRMTARIESSVLRLEYPGGAVDQWDRWYPN